MSFTTGEVAGALDRHAAVLRMIAGIDVRKLEELVIDELEAHIGTLDESDKKLTTTVVSLTVEHITAGVITALDTS